MHTADAGKGGSDEEVRSCHGEDPAVARIFVFPGAKVQMCKDATGDRRWLRKIRPWWGHHYHFHVRLNCPRGARGCEDQAPPPAGDGCADAEEWVRNILNPPPPDPNAPAPKPRRPAGRKPTVLVSSSAAPALLGRWSFGTVRQLRQAARMFGGRVRGTCFTGLAASAPDLGLSVRQRRKAERIARRLITRSG